MHTLPCQRHLFDIPDDIAYFNCAYNSPQLNASKKRLLAGVLEKSHPWNRTKESFFADAETIRTLAARAFGGSANGYAIIPAASYGISTAARAIEPQLRVGDEILLIEEEFPSNVLPWRRTAMHTGARIRTIPRPHEEGWTGAVLAAIAKTTRVVALSACHWTNGAQIDLVAVGKACREHDVILVVDATQALGAMPIDLEAIGADFVVAAGYKWLLFPYGLSLMHVSDRWHDARPLEESWLARDNAANFAELANYSDAYLPGARRFDVGEKCAASLLPGAIAALEQLCDWGTRSIAATLREINLHIAQRLEALNFLLPTEAERCPHLFGAQVPRQCTANLVSALHGQNIFVSQRGRAIRFSPHLHVTQNDIDRLCDAMEFLVR